MAPERSHEREYGRGQRAADTIAVALFALLFGVVAARVLPRIDARGLTIVTAACAIGFVAADFVSGVVHWIGDTWGAEDWPILGRSLIRPFREHHLDPLAITRHGFVETNGNSSLGSLLLLGAAAALPEAGHLALFLKSLLLSLSGWLLATNQIHKWAHSPTPPRAVAWLQERRWILAPGHHAVHHSPPFDRYYCITTGWLNPLLTRARFFPRLESVVRAVTGAIPRAAEQER